MLATQIVAKYGFEPQDCRFFETYREYDNETFDEIEYTWKQIRSQNGKIYWEAKYPKWKPSPESRFRGAGLYSLKVLYKLKFAASTASNNHSTNIIIYFELTNKKAPSSYDIN